jgi:hypothetical protein
MAVIYGDGEVALLASVVKRAFDDIGLRYRSSGSMAYAKKAVDWITGSCAVESNLDKVMSFSTICETLGWPEKELINLANKLYEGEYDSVKRIRPDVLLPYRGRIASSEFDTQCHVVKCEGLLRDILFDPSNHAEINTGI